MANPQYVLFGKKVSDTYHNLLQSGSDGKFYDGDGNEVTINATIPDIYVKYSQTGSFAITGSNQFNGNQTITGSLIQGLPGNIATGEYSHAEGSITKAIGDYSHAEGDNTQAVGNYSHAEGQETIALGQYSHAEGNNTIASASWQHVQGQWNATSPVPAAFIVGNGTDDSTRSNLIYAAGNEVQISGSLIATSFTGSFTGSLLGTASYAANGGVTQLLAGSNITLSPTNGLGQVTISSTGGGGSSFNTATGSYGSFYDTTTQTNPVGNVPRSMSLNTTAITNGVSISGSTNPFNTYIKTENAGVYNIQFSAQLDKTDSGTDEIVIWLRKNGIDLIDTATTISLVGNNSKNVAAWNWFVTSAANDYYQIIWYSPDTAVRLLAETIGGGHPGIPSVIVTANRVDQFLSNTGSFSGSFTGSLLGTGSWAINALTASNSELLDGIDSSQFARLDIDNTFNGINTVTQKTLRDNSSYVIAETSISSDVITGPDTQSIEVFNIYNYVTYTTDRPALNTAATFDYTIFDDTLTSIRSGRVNLSWTPNNTGQEAITDTQTIVNAAESGNIIFNTTVDYGIGSEFVKLNVVNGASKPIYIRGFLRII